MNLTLFGAGAWGTALAVSAAANHSTVLWSRSEGQSAQMREARVNKRYLDGVSLPDELVLTADFDAALAHARGGLAVVATPMAGLGEMLHRLRSNDADAPGLLWLCKGFEHDSGRLGHEVARAAWPEARRIGLLSGPSFAIEVARGQPTALVVASADASVCDAAVQALHGDALRIYTSDDVIGVEVGGALKNVLAIAVGICDGLDGGAAGRLGLGLNARAALITRGLAEMTRLGAALGARAETFMGLSGLGDLVLTATGDLSRNRQVGLLLARGLALPQILQQLGHVAEGVLCAEAVLARAQALGVDMPITLAVVHVLQGKATPAQALAQLMGRSARAEVGP
jgi:glycerol-3-phosphate dehydrogenase (NAD(P)+)